VAAILAAAGIAATKGSDGALWALVVLGSCARGDVRACAAGAAQAARLVRRARSSPFHAAGGDVDEKLAGPGTIWCGWGCFHDGRSELERTRVTSSSRRHAKFKRTTYDGRPETRGRAMPDTSEGLLPGVMSRVWQEKSDFDSG